MAVNVKAIEARIQGCQNNIDKVKATLQRHQARLEKKYVACVKEGIADPDTCELGGCDLFQRNRLYEYNHIKEDIATNERKLKGYEQKLADYIEQKEQAVAKNTVPIVSTVEEFLARWRQSAHEYYTDKANELLEWKTWYAEYKQQQLKEMQDKYGYAQANSRSPEMKAEREQRKIDYQYADKYIRAHYNALIVRIEDCLRYKGAAAADTLLNEVLDQEVINKRVDFFTRCAAVIGTVIDASDLREGNNGFINGYVIGERGKAWVETISAGGYNIQCFHYRVLIKKVKED